MKRGLSLVVCAVALACFARAEEQGREFDVPKLDSVVVDGEDGDWGENGFRIGLLAAPSGELRDAQDLDATIRLGWNEKGLLILAWVKDNAWVEHADEGALWKNDSIEVFLSPKRGAWDLCQWVIAPGLSARQPEPRAHLHDHRKDEALKRAPAKPTVARRRIDDESYRMEILLPWEALAIVPELGREVGFQIWVDDADDEASDDPFHAAWYPSTKAWRAPVDMHGLRLSDHASPPDVARIASGYDDDLLRPYIRVTAAPELAGKTLSFVSHSRTIGTRTLTVNNIGLAEARLNLPDEPDGRTDVVLEDRVLGSVSPADSERQRARLMFWMTPVADPAVFAGEVFPPIRWEMPLYAERLIGPHRLDTTYYNANYEVVKRAEAPGRYGAVVDIVTDSGQRHRRFITLYRMDKPLDWRRYELEATLTPPEELGVPSGALPAQPEAIADFVKWQTVEGNSRGDEFAVLLCGLRELESGGKKNDFYSRPEQLDRRWWVGLKRTLYGWNKQFPDPFVCPRTEEGAHAPVLREGTAAEAGMKPDAAATIDAVLTEWASDTDQAFAVCIARHGVIVLHKAYGMRDGKPMTVDTQSWMASMTKMLSGTLIMMLVDQGLIDLEAPAATYLPTLKGVEFKTPPTIRRMYNHTCGFEEHWGDQLNDMEERITAILPHLNVGEAWRYDGTGMELACKILEGVSGETLPDFFRNHLLDPLGCRLTDVGSASHDARSVPMDIAKIAQMVLNGGAYGSMRFVRADVLKDMLPRKVEVELGGQVYGIGTQMFVHDGLSEQTFAHGAASAATVRVDPVNDLVIVMTRNHSGRKWAEYHPRFIRAVVDGMLRE